MTERPKQIQLVRRAGAVSVLLSLLCAAACSAAAPRAPSGAAGYHPAPFAERFGVNAQVMFWSMPGYRWSDSIAEMRADGIQTVRADAPWNAVQPTATDGSRHLFDWKLLDRIVGALAAQQMRWLPVIDYSAGWAASLRQADGSPDLLSPPASDSAYAAFAAAVVARYGPGGRFWSVHRELPRVPITAVEIWNEENDGYFWHPAADAGAYLGLYEAARAAVHATDPAVEVLVGGLSNPAPDYLNALYAAAGERRGIFDGVAIHPYGNAVGDVLEYVASSRQTLDVHGDIDTPLDVTEVGWPSITSQLGLLPHPPSPTVAYVSDAQRASDLSAVTATLAGADCGVERILPNTWVTPQQNLDDAEQWYGIVNRDGAPTATATAYSAAITNLERQGAPARAGTSVCGRSFSLTASARPPAARRHDRRHRLGRECVRIVASSLGSPVDGALVTLARPGHATRWLHTREDGTAIACLSAPRGRRIDLMLTAQRSDFTSQPQTELRLRAL